MNNPSGSIWRKWDLHIHTPETAKNDQFSTVSPWEDYLVKLESMTDIAVLGVTDYFSIDNYIKLKKYQELGRIPDKSLIPNIELRILPVTGENTPINLHVLFNPEIEISTIEREFFRNLKFSYQGSEYACIESDLIALGRAYTSDTTLEEHAAWKAGIDQFNVPFTELKKILKSESLIGHYLICVSNRSSDGNSGIQHSSLAATRQEIYRFSHIIFSSNPNDVQYFLGKGVDSVSKVKDDYGSLKPCVVGSDAHSLAEVCVYPGNRTTWIKADPTFEGLKQIIFEPEERVRIQENSPDDNFDKLYFKSIKGNGAIILGEAVEYDAVELDFNKNLVAIIGGRGTGKSLLLDCLLKSFSRHEEINDDRFSSISINQFSTVFEKQDSTEIASDILSPQPLSYLHVRQSEIKEIAKSPDKLTTKIKELLGLNEIIQDSNNDFTIRETLDKIEEIKQWLNQKNENGDLINSKEYCNLWIRYYSHLITNITSKETQDVIAKYQKSQATINTDSQRSAEIDLKIEEIGQFQQLLNNFIAKINDYALTTKLNLKLQSWNFDNILQPLTEYNQKLHTRKSKLTESNEAIKQKLIKAGINQDVATLLEKVNEHQNNLSGFENHKDNIIKKIDELTNLAIQRNTSIDSVLKKLQENKVHIDLTFSALKEGKDGWLPEQKQLLNKILVDIDIRADIIFDTKTFYDGIRNIVNGSKFRDSQESTGIEKIQTLIGVDSLETYKSLCKGEKICTLEGVSGKTIDDIGGQLDLFRGNTEYNLYEYIYLREHQCKYSKVIPRLTYKGKPPEKLSVGQRGTFYLCLRLATDPFGSPFVFDQPEDDLDNEFIVQTLIPIFKEIKKYRQVIIATHNANFVVNADAEQIIVAKNNAEHITFISGALEKKEIKDDVCRILEGGKPAFIQREHKYGFIN